MKRTTPVCLLLLLAHFLPNNASAAPYGSGWYREIQASVGYADNLARSYRSLDDSADITSSIAAGIGYSDKIQENLQFVVSGYVAYNHHDEFDKLNNIAASIGASLAYQPTTSFDSLWYESTLELSRLDYRDSEAREGYLYVGSVSINRRLRIITTGRVGYRYLDFVGDGAFDVARHELFIGVEQTLNDRMLLSAEYGYHHGGFTASFSGTPNPAHNFDDITEDPVFKTCVASACDNWSAYRSIVDLHVMDVGLAYTFDMASLDVSARYYRGGADRGPTYSNWLIQLGAIWNF